MTARRGKSQARRNSGGNRLPGWAWLVLGIVLTVLVVLAIPRLLRSEGSDGFFRPKPNPDAQPAAAVADDAIVPDDNATPEPAAAGKPKGTQYDFYTLLPANEVAMSDAELAATARAETERRARADDAAASATGGDAADVAAAAASEAVVAPPAAAGARVAATAGSDTPYILQAGAFGGAGDAETVKARIALLGLSARVEAADIQGKTVYRVRMGPYGTASELADAKRKLANGGLPALAIKAR
ncbi:MAG: SPOR domain-containing protein [Luteimonas sp.]